MNDMNAKYRRLAELHMALNDLHHTLKTIKTQEDLDKYIAKCDELLAEARKLRNE